MNRSIQNPSERISRKERIHQSIKHSQQQFLLSLEKQSNKRHLPDSMKLPESEMYIIESPLDIKPSRRRRAKSNIDVVVGDRKRTTKEGKKKKQSKKTKDRSERQQQQKQKVLIIPECEDCLYLEDLVEKHQPRSWQDSITISLGEDDSYMSDITDEDEIIEKARKPKKVKRKKRRPKSERDLAESFRTQRSSPTSTRSLDLPTQQLRRPRSSFESNSGRTRRAGNRTKPLRKTELELISVISDEIGLKPSSSRRLLKSERPLRRPRSSFEKNLMAKRRASTRKKGEKSTKTGKGI